MHDFNKKCDRERTLVSGSEAEIGSPLTADQIQRWAVLIADGGDSFPSELSPKDRERLTAEVQRLLRERLLNLIARAIAQDIFRCERSDTEVYRD